MRSRHHQILIGDVAPCLPIRAQAEFLFPLPSEELALPRQKARGVICDDRVLMDPTHP